MSAFGSDNYCEIASDCIWVTQITNRPLQS